MKLAPCSGSGTSLQQTSASTAIIKANASNYQWCFTGEDKQYRISFAGDQYSGPVVYNWIATPDARELGFYNVRDFGAVGDGKTDDISLSEAIRIHRVTERRHFALSDGDYVVTEPIALPSGIKIVGTNGLGSMAGTSDLPRKNPSRITLSGTNRTAF